VVGNLGLAVNKNSYAVLLVLRAIQSLGASAAFAVSYGVVADVYVPSERGQMLGPVGMALNVGSCVGPIVWGWVAYTSEGYEWAFWALVILGGILWLGVIALLPETARTLTLLSTAGRGWYFTALGIWSGGCGAVAVYLIENKGMGWRTKKLSKDMEKRST